jgi:hypothetical protein
MWGFRWVIFTYLLTYLPKLLFSCASLHLPTTLMMARPAIRVQCMTAVKFGSLLAWVVMSAPNCGGLMMIISATNWLANISVSLCVSRDICHSGRNTTLDTLLSQKPLGSVTLLCLYTDISCFSSHSSTKLLTLLDACARGICASQ